MDSTADIFRGFTQRRLRVAATDQTPQTPTRQTGIPPEPQTQSTFTFSDDSDPTPLGPRTSPENPFAVAGPSQSRDQPPHLPFVLNPPRTPAEGSTRVPTTQTVPTVGATQTQAPPAIPPRPTQQAAPPPAQTAAPPPQAAAQLPADALATAIGLLTQTLQQGTPQAPPHSNQSERNNVRDPDQYDGSDTTKLRSFFAQLELVFKARPRTFATEEKKVTYAISYLKGTALQWFEPYLLEGSNSANPPVFMTDYEAFQEELSLNFGPYDATGAAEHELENLQMAENHRIAKYITQFNRLATQVRWGTSALRYQFYRGLPARLKDRISEVGKPDDLFKLRDLAQSLDHRYWERKTEQARKSRNSRPTPSKPSDAKSAPPSKSASSSGSQPSSTPSKSASQSQGKSTPKATPKPYADKLGKDGKLSPEERKRRFENNLCLFCGGAGHSAAACPKKTSTAKGRATEVTPDSEDADSASAQDEPKN